MSRITSLFCAFSIATLIAGNAAAQASCPVAYQSYTCVISSVDVCTTYTMLGYIECQASIYVDDVVATVDSNGYPVIWGTLDIGGNDDKFCCDYNTLGTSVLDLHLYTYGGDDTATLYHAASSTTWTADTLVHTGPGDDTIEGSKDSNYSDELHGNAGNDTINANAGDDTVFGDGGVDTITGGDGDDTLYGGDGDDDIHGNAGMECIDGGDGEDDLSGDANDDCICGGMDSHDDVLDCGTGTDDYYFNNQTQNDTQTNCDTLQSNFHPTDVCGC